MNRLFVSLLRMCVVVTMIMIAQSSYAQGQNQEVIMIAHPPNGSSVGREGTVSGTAQLLQGHYLWVLVRRSDFNPLWWPQREAEVHPITHQWKSSVSYGEARDIGRDFDIGVISVDQQGHNALYQYWMDAMRTGRWNAFDIPPILDPPQIRTVHKVSH